MAVNVVFPNQSRYKTVLLFRFPRPEFAKQELFFQLCFQTSLCLDLSLDAPVFRQMLFIVFL